MKIANNKKTLYGALSGIMLIIILVFIVLLKKVNVGTNGDKNIGLSKINLAIYNSLGTNKIMDIISTIILAMAGALALFFVVIGIIEVVKRKKLEMLDNSIKALALVYVITGWIYLIFDYILVINYRPTAECISSSPSFPSTHTMLILMIFLTGITVLEGLIKNKKLLYSVEICFGLLGILAIVTRMLSGKHWFTDIIAGILFAIMLYFFHKFIIELLNEYQVKHTNNQ